MNASIRGDIQQNDRNNRLFMNRLRAIGGGVGIFCHHCAILRARMVGR